MDVSDLRVFAAVARHGSMNRAAGELNTVQSNVTSRIRLLEMELGTPLFQRNSKGVVLTDAGRRLLSYAARIDQLLDEARRAVKDDGTPKGSLTIGSLETTAALRLSPVLTDFVASCPKVDLVLKTGTTCELIQDTLSHKVEGAFVCGPVSHRDLDSETFFHEELVVLSSPHVASLERYLISQDVRIIVLRKGCSYRQFLEDLLSRRGLVDVRHLEFGTLEAIYSSVSAGLGITLLPKALVGSVWRAGRVAVHELPAAEAQIETVFIRRRDAFTSSALSAFLRTARPLVRQPLAAE